MMLNTFAILTIVACAFAAPENGVYVISNDFKENGQNVTLVLDACAAKAGQKTGDVVTNSYENLASSHWNITKSGWLHCLTPQENPKNQVTDKGCGGAKGYRFRPAGNGTHFIEHLVGRRTPSCLRNNGRNKPISFVNCRSQEVRSSSTFLWKLIPVSSTTTTTTETPAQ